MQVETPCVFPANHNGKSVVESQRRRDRQPEAVQVLFSYTVVNVGGASLGLFLQDRCERRARVLGIEIDAPAQDRLMADVAPGQVKAPLDRQARFRFQVLGDQLAEDGLFGEIFRADDDALSSGRTAGEQKAEGRKQKAEGRRQSAVSSKKGTQCLP